jgi:hypothetical protein
MITAPERLRSLACVTCTVVPALEMIREQRLMSFGADCVTSEPRRRNVVKGTKVRFSLLHCCRKIMRLHP